MFYAITSCAIAALIYLIRQSGRAAAEDEQMKQVLDDINKANNIRAGLDHDPAAAERLRDRFTR